MFNVNGLVVLSIMFLLGNFAFSDALFLRLPLRKSSAREGQKDQKG